MKKLKNNKLVLIIIVVIILIGLGFVLLKNNDYNKYDLSDLYNLAWHKSGVALYEDGVLINENLDIFRTGRYIVFYEGYMEYVKPEEDSIERYNYTYDENGFAVEGPDYLLPEGTYQLEFVDEYIKFTRNIDKQTVSYYFQSSVG